MTNDTALANSNGTVTLDLEAVATTSAPISAAVGTSAAGSYVVQEGTRAQGRCVQSALDELQTPNFHTDAFVLCSFRWAAALSYTITESED